MAKWPKSTALVISADSLITSHPAWLHGVIVNVTVAGGDVQVFEGQDSTSGRKLLHLDATASESLQAVFAPPLWCERGIYVDLGSNVAEVTVHFTPQPLIERQED